MCKDGVFYLGNNIDDNLNGSIFEEVVIVDSFEIIVEVADISTFVIVYKFESFSRPDIGCWGKGIGLA